MYNILYLHSLPHFGGGETALYSLMMNLDHNQFKTCLVLPKEGPLAEKVRSIGSEVYIIPFSRGIFGRYPPGLSMGAIFRIYSLAKKLNINLIHINDSYLIIYAGIAGKLLGIPVVFTQHWDSYFIHQDILNNIFLDKIVAINKQIEKCILYRKILRPEKVTQSYLGVDTDRFCYSEDRKKAKQKLGISENDYTVSIVGRFNYQKDHLTFLDAAYEIIKEIKNIKFLIVGEKIFDLPSEKKEIKENIIKKINSHNELKEKVKLLGFREDIPEILAATDVLVCSSVSESLPLSIIESMSCGVPVVSTDVGSINEIIEHKVTGFLVPVKNPLRIAEHVSYLLKNPNVRTKIGKNTRQKMIEMFSIKRYVKKTEKLYNELLT